MEVLLNNGAKINLANRNGQTALHVAAEWSKIQKKICSEKSSLHSSFVDRDMAVRKLLQYGANRNLIDTNGMYPTDLAAAQGNCKI